jgi:dsDNA-specific endonuclease/ATPase MutS2
MFHPRDAAALVRDFLDAASLRGDRDLRIIHGKGIGVQRGIVRAILEGDPRVEWFGDSPDRSGWGATLVRLRGTAL